MQSGHSFGSGQASTAGSLLSEHPKKALARQKRAASEAVDSLLQEAHDTHGGLWRFLPDLQTQRPPERAAASNQSTAFGTRIFGNLGRDTAQQTGGRAPAPSPRGAWTAEGAATAPGLERRAQEDPCGCGPNDRKVLGKSCSDAFGASAADSRHWPFAAATAPAQPKRPPGSTASAAAPAGVPTRGGGWWPTGAQKAPLAAEDPLATEPQPRPLPLDRAKATGPPPLRAICGAPLSVFLIAALAFALVWQAWPLPVTLTALSLVVAVHTTLPQPHYSKGPLGAGDLVPCVVCIFAAISGTFTGIYAHEAYTSPFYVVALGNEYHNVLASTTSAAYGDAGRLHFANTSSLDYDRVLGYRDRRTYCVAPIVDSGASQTRRVSFWAVGLDCCSYRGDFECGDAGADAGNVKAGARAPQDGIFERPRSDFLRAIDQASAVYDLEADPDLVLLHWVADPAQAQRTSLLCAFGVVLLGAALFVLVAIAALAATSVAA